MGKNKRHEKAVSTKSSAREFLRSRLSRLKNGFDSALNGAGTADGRVLETNRYDDLEFINGINKATSEADMFGVLVVRADQAAAHTGNAAHEDPGPQADHIAGVVEAVCRRADGVWGAMESGMFGCCVPGFDDDACLKTAEEIIRGVHALNNGSVSIGTARYPMLDYNRDEIVENAYKALNHAAFLGPGSTVAFDAVSLNISGDVLYQAGDIKGAADEFERGLRIDPRDENLNNSLGVCYGELGDLAGALGYFETVLAINPNSVLALHNAGYVKAMLDDPEGALAYFMRADAQDGSIFEIAFHTGKLLVEAGHQERAKPYLERAVKLNPAFGKAHYLMGECSRGMGLTDEAVRAYKSAIRRNPNDADALSALGLLYDEMGENPEIPLIFCEKSVELSPENGLFACRFGQVLMNQEKTQRALTMFEKARDLGYDAEEWIAAARAALSQGGQEGRASVGKGE
ncbi:MAG: tetratricopeptide repeat protein [Deltaproteobacteria bacterium]|nr:tetratricopeptide repeat protein [Deltaproteobacteria bacterium]